MVGSQSAEGPSALTSSILNASTSVFFVVQVALAGQVSLSLAGPPTTRSVLVSPPPALLCAAIRYVSLCGESNQTPQMLIAPFGQVKLCRSPIFSGGTPA